MEHIRIQEIQNEAKKSLYLAFDLTKYSLVICCVCGQSYHLLLSHKDPSRYFYRHWADAGHPMQDNPGRAGFRAEFNKMLGNSAELLTCKRSPIVTTTMLEPYRDLLILLSLTRTDVCVICWRPKMRPEPCCYPSFQLETTVACVGNKKGFVLVSGQEAETLMKRKKELIILKENLPKPSTDTDAILQELIAGVEKLKLQSDAILERSNADVGSTSTKAIMQASRNQVIKELAAGNSGSGVTLSEASMDKTGYIGESSLMAGESIFQAINQEVVEKMPEKKRVVGQSRFTQSEQCVLEIFGCEIHIDEKALYDFAEVSKPLSRSNTLDLTFLECSKLMSTMKSGTEVEKRPAVIEWIMKCTMIDSALPRSTIQERSGMQASVLLHNNLRHSEEVFNRSAVFGARFLRVIYSTNKNIQTILNEILAEESGHGDDPKETMQRCSTRFAKVYHNYFVAALSSSTENLIDYLRRFVAEYAHERLERYTGDDGESGSDDDSKSEVTDDSDDDSEVGEESSSPRLRRVVITKPSQLGKIVNSVLWLMKFVLFNETNGAIELAKIRGEPLNLVKFVRGMVGSSSLASMGVMISKLSLIEESMRHPSRNDVIGKEDQDGFRMMILDGGIEITRAHLQRCGYYLVTEILDRLKAVIWPTKQGAEHEAMMKWETLKLEIFKGKDSYFHFRASRKGFVKLSKSSGAYAVLDWFIKNRGEADPKYRLDLASLQRYLFAAVFVLGGAIARPKDAIRLIRGVSKTGTLFLDEDWQGILTLMFRDLISKTKKGGRNILPAWLSRILLVYLDILAPHLIPLLLSEARDAVAMERNKAEAEELLNQQAWATLEGELKRSLKDFLKTYVGAAFELGKNFQKKLKSIPVNVKSVAKDLSLWSKDCIPLLTVKEIETGLVDIICVKGFGAAKMTLRQVRKILINVKKQPFAYLPEPMNEEDADFRKYMLSLKEFVKENREGHETLDGLASIAHNSSATTKGSYLARASTTGYGNNDAEIDMKAIRCSAALTELVFNTPSNMTILTLEGRKMTHQRCPVLSSIWHSLSMESMSDEDNGEEVPATMWNKAYDALLSKLESISGFKSWIDDAQRDIAFTRLTETCDLIVGRDCGGGKTLAVLVPALMAPRGVTVCLFPTRALVQDMYETIRALQDQQSVVRLLEPSNEDEFFDTTVFVKPSWSRYTHIRLVLTTYDTGCSRKARTWYAAARERGLLNGFFIDEVHQIFLSAHFRKVMYDMIQISNYGVPVTVASGTLPIALEEAVLERLSLRTIGLKRFKEQPVYGKRRIVDLVHVKECGSLPNWLRNAVASIEPTGSNNCAVVFCMTKSLAKACYTSLQQTDTSDVYHIDSETLKSKVKATLQALKKPQERRQVVVCTSVASEGIDFPRVGLVVVLEGTYGGLLTLHQMFSRCGRGLPRTGSGEEGRLPRCILIYCPDRFPRPKENPEVTAEANDKSLLESFPVGFRSEMRGLVGFRSLQRLFQQCPVRRCGGQLMELSLGGTVSEPCNECFDCVGKKHWKVPLPSGKVWNVVNEGDDGEAIPARSFGGSRDAEEMTKDEMIRRADEETSKIAMEFLQSHRGACLVCGHKPAHYPNECPKIIEVFAKNKKGMGRACNICLQDTHFSRDVTKLIDEAKKNPSEKKSSLRQFLFQKGCLVLTEEDYFNVCVACWLPKTAPKGEPNIHDLIGCCDMSRTPCRSILLRVFYDDELRNAFLSDVSPERINVGKVKTVRDLMLWTVNPENSRDCSNLMTLIAFWVRKQSTFGESKEEKKDVIVLKKARLEA